MFPASDAFVGLRRKVLIVEDNPDLRRLYAIGLNQRGYEVKLAANGAEAVDRIASERPDVILLDLMMPVMDGWEVIDRVSAPEAGEAIPVVVITGQHQSGEDRRNDRIAAWLSKPVTISYLVDVLEHLPA
jgi:CheY-like chemotaxis protein